MPMHRPIARRRLPPRRIAMLTALALAIGFAAAPRAGAADDPLIGLWAFRAADTPGLRGELTVARRGTAWRATLGRAEATAEATGAQIRLRFPGNGGEFRGAIAGKALEGFWLQPAAVERDPAGESQSYATPVSLAPAGRDTWRGQLRPFENRFTLYLKIYRGADGALVGAFRNPERNSNGGAMVFQVARDGDKVRFRLPSAPGATTAPPATGPSIDAALLRSPDRLHLRWPDLDRDLDLVRTAPAQAVSFFPRPPGEPKYTYRTPPVTGDGWVTARGRDVGLDEAALAQLIQRLIDGDPAIRRAPLIHSILVARRGKLALEEYFYGHDRDTPHDVRSAGKTFASVMLGAEIRQGVHLALDSKIYDVLAGAGSSAHPDPRKAKITIAQLLTHTTGLTCDDNDDASPGNESLLWSQRAQPDLWKYTLDLAMAHDPGTRYAYCSAGINLVGGALTAATATWLPELFDRTIARPLQFGRYYWNLDRRGEGYLGGGAQIRPRDLLKLGQAYLAGGAWQQRRIVDAAWVAQSIEPRIEISLATTGLTAEVFQNGYIQGANGPARDGYAWHLIGVRAGDRSYRDFEATGNGGQLLIVIPELELVVVITGGNYEQGGIWNRWRNDVVGEQLILRSIR